MKRTVYIILGIFIALLVLLTISWKMYNKPHRNVMRATEAYQVDAEHIMDEYTGDMAGAHEKYGGEIIVLTGKFSKNVAGKDGRQYIIIQGSNGTVSCEMEEAASLSGGLPEFNTNIKVKGICVGYDDLLGELQMKKCSITGF
jgi:hypothetical protein